VCFHATARTLVDNGTPAVRPVRKSKGLPRDGLAAETAAAGAIAGIHPSAPEEGL